MNVNWPLLFVSLPMAGIAAVWLWAQVRKWPE